MATTNPLRPITQRLNSIPVSDLPQHAGLLASSILNCSKLLQTSNDQRSDTSVQVNKLNTRISALLHDKTLEGRFTGLVLVKALIEAGGSQCLYTSALSWIRGLLFCLNKQDPPEVRMLSVYGVTRVFLLSRDHQSIVREVTTPNLPAFINSCVSAIKPAKSHRGGRDVQSPSCLLVAVLQCWSQLIVAFPSTFRPFIPTIRGIVLSLLSDPSSPARVVDMALQVTAVLHCSAPKDTASSEWLQTCQSAIKSAHQAADLLFRSVIEDWSTNGAYQLPTTGKRTSTNIRTSINDDIGLNKWSGFQAGISRLTILIDLLQFLMESSQTQTVRAPLAHILDLTARLSAVIQPSKEYTLGENKEISRDERDELYMSLPQIHRSTIRLLHRLVLTYGQALLPVYRSIISQTWDIFESNTSHETVRVAVYDVTASYMREKALVLSSADTDRLTTLLRSCCADLRSSSDTAGQELSHAQNTQNSLRTLEVKQSQSKPPLALSQTSRSCLFKAAWELLSVALFHIPPGLLPSIVRAEIDKTSILVGHRDAMLASVMNPHQVRGVTRVAPSIFPFWSRTAGADPATEALLRPRHPIIQDVMQGVYEEPAEEMESVSLAHESLEALVELPVSTVNHDELAGTPSDQLGEELSHRVASDEQTVRKREHEAVETEAITEDQGLTKKAKLVERQTDIPISTEHSEKLDVTLESVGLQPITADVASTVSSVKRVDPTAFTEEIVPGVTDSLQASDQDDDSDDSEIPQIDATLSSEDDDDEMEG